MGCLFKRDTFQFTINMFASVNVQIWARGGAGCLFQIFVDRRVLIFEDLHFVFFNFLFKYCHKHLILLLLLLSHVGLHLQKLLLF